MELTNLQLDSPREKREDANESRNGRDKKKQEILLF